MDLELTDVVGAAIAAGRLWDINGEDPQENSYGDLERKAIALLVAPIWSTIPAEWRTLTIEHMGSLPQAHRWFAGFARALSAGAAIAAARAGNHEPGQRVGGMTAQLERDFNAPSAAEREPIKPETPVSVARVERAMVGRLEAPSQAGRLMDGGVHGPGLG